MPHYNVLFLCTGNSARSIMAEAIMNRKGAPNFTAYSVGSHPSGTVRPEALRQIEAASLPITDFHSKSWDEFAKPDAPRMSFVFTVCDNAAKEVCPIWPGQPMTAHWGCPILRLLRERRKRSNELINKRSPFWSAASRCCLLCRWQASIRCRSRTN